MVVVMRQEIHPERGPALSEEHDIVYRDHPLPDEVPVIQTAPDGAVEWERTVRPRAPDSKFPARFVSTARCCSVP